MNENYGADSGIIGRIARHTLVELIFDRMNVLYDF